MRTRSPSSFTPIESPWNAGVIRVHRTVAPLTLDAWRAACRSMNPRGKDDHAKAKTSATSATSERTAMTRVRMGCFTGCSSARSGGSALVERRDLARDPAHLLQVQAGIDGKRQHLPRQSLGHREAPGVVAQYGEARLRWHHHRLVDVSRYLSLSEWVLDDVDPF